VNRQSHPQAVEAKKFGRVARRRSGRHCAWLFVPALLIAALPINQDLNSGQQGDGAKDSDLRVSVTVPVRAELKILKQTTSIMLTQKDIELRSLEATAATRMTIINNDKSGCLLLFEGLDRPFKKALISGLDREVQVGLPAAFIHLPYSSKPATYTLSYRFDLSDDAKPGKYSWPFTVSVQPNP
jgi:hypothetical protein